MSISVPELFNVDVWFSFNNLIVERVQLEKQKTKDAYRDAEEIKQKEMERIKREMEELEKGLKERINKLEARRIDLEEEISRMKTAAATDKLQMDEQLLNAKARIKQEEVRKLVVLLQIQYLFTRMSKFGTKMSVWMWRISGLSVCELCVDIFHRSSVSGSWRIKFDYSRRLKMSFNLTPLHRAEQSQIYKPNCHPWRSKTMHLNTK